MSLGQGNVGMRWKEGRKEKGGGERSKEGKKGEGKEARKEARIGMNE